MYFWSKSREYHPVAPFTVIQFHHSTATISYKRNYVYILYCISLDWQTKYLFHFYIFLFRMTKGKLKIEVIKKKLVVSCEHTNTEFQVLKCCNVMYVFGLESWVNVKRVYFFHHFFFHMEIALACVNSGWVPFAPHWAEYKWLNELYLFCFHRFFLPFSLFWRWEELFVCLPSEHFVLATLFSNSSVESSFVSSPLPFACVIYKFQASFTHVSNRFSSTILPILNTFRTIIMRRLE